MALSPKHPSIIRSIGDSLLRMRRIADGMRAPIASSSLSLEGAREAIARANKILTHPISEKRDI